MQLQSCPCAPDKNYVDCCGRFIDAETLANSPVELMRSRYTAYTLANMTHVMRTMRAKALKHFDENAARDWARQVKWLRLEIINASEEGDKGHVEFIAHFELNKKHHVLHEKSEFERIAGAWYYTDGKDPRANAPRTVKHIGRNDACLCGSGKKYKKCCGKI